MNERQRAILQQVAEGRLSPEEAAVLMHQAEQEQEDQQDRPSERSGATERGDEAGQEEGEQARGAPPGGQSSPPGAGTEGAIRRVRVIGSFRSARIIGDPTVREAVADGPHMARREGDLLIIKSALDESDLPGFVFNRGRSSWRLTVPPDVAGWGHAGRAPRPPRPGRWWAGEEAWQRPWSLSQLTVRMRPDLPLEVELSAGTLHAHGVTGPLHFDVRAGSARIEGARGPLDATVAAGSLRADAVLLAGRSRIRCDASSVRVHLERGSSVLVRARADLSHLSLPDRGVVGTWSGGEREEVKIGDGAATLDIEANLSSVGVTADR